MRTVRLLGVVALVAVFSVVARADSTGPDGHPIIGTSGGHSPSCSTFQASTDASGNTNTDCAVTGFPATSITFAILDANSNGGLSIGSPLITTDHWTVHCTPGVVDMCTLTAPSDTSESEIVNDEDCDLDDAQFGVPVGCDITISTLASGGLPFDPNSLFDLSTNENPLASLPEPNVALLLVIGLSSLAIFRRKLAL